MAERKQIALIYEYNLNWIAGTYYILNIIKALNFLPDHDKPHLVVYHDNRSAITDIQNISYPYIMYIGFDYKLKRVFKYLNTFLLLTIGRTLVTIKLPSINIKNFYYRNSVINISNIENYYCWIADFQDLYLPQFFKKRELKCRMATYRRIEAEKQPIVFSSQSALDDFNKFFPKNTNTKRILQFVSTSNSSFGLLSIVDLKKKFNVAGDYFIVSNQFWQHKNHLVVLKAFNILLKDNPSIQLLLTGKEYDHRGDNYMHELRDYVIKNDLKDKILFLGFIDRDEQLKLMSESIAIVQPSLFEGWSTVVEDAKFLNKPVICSDIPVHKEQLPNSDMFFDPKNEHTLVAKMKEVLAEGYVYKGNFNHHEEVLKFAECFTKLFP